MFLEPCLGNCSWTRCLTLVYRSLSGTHLEVPFEHTNGIHLEHKKIILDISNVWLLWVWVVVTVSFALNFPFLKEVSQNCFVFDVVNLENWGSPAELLSFLTLKTGALSQDCCVFDVGKFKNWGSLAEYLRFKLADRQTDRQAGRQSDRQTETDRDRQRQTETDRQTDRDRQRQTDMGRQIDNCNYTTLDYNFNYTTTTTTTTTTLH